MTDACRSVCVLNRMTDTEAKAAGVENPRLYFRAFIDKGNCAPPAVKSDWYKLEGVDLGNGEPGEADNVAVATSWRYPDPMDTVQVSHLREAQEKIAAGRYRESSQANDWAGKAVAEVMHLDLSNPASKAKVSGILKTWTANGMFKVVEAKDEATRRMFKFLEVDKWAD